MCGFALFTVLGGVTMNTATRKGYRWFVHLTALVIGALIAMSSARAEAEGPSLKMSDALNAAHPTATRVAAAPAAAPVRLTMNDYRIGTEDLLEIQVFGVDQLSRTVRVNSMGAISLPLIGSLEIAGLTPQEAESLIARKLGDSYLQNPQVSLFVKEYTNQRVTVEGAVNKPGIYPLRGQTTLLRTLAIAGGQGSLSDMSEVMLFRVDMDGKRVAQQFDVEKIRRGELEDPMVINDDLIVVNRSRARTALKDSIFRDVLDAINPFSPLMPR
jgi:polysaccharide export outer membrane protein